VRFPAAPDRLRGASLSFDLLMTTAIMIAMMTTATTIAMMTGVSIVDAFRGGARPLRARW
jgi:hypothetical protein